VYNSPPLAPILSQMNPIYSPKSYFSNIQFNIILLSTPRSSEWSLASRTSNRKCVRMSPDPYVRYKLRPAYPHLFDHLICEGYKLWISLLRSFYLASGHFIPLRSIYSPKHPTLKYPQPVFLSEHNRSGFTSIQNKR
jgi:hypothetical protein